MAPPGWARLRACSCGVGVVGAVYSHQVTPPTAAASAREVRAPTPREIVCPSDRRCRLVLADFLRRLVEGVVEGASVSSTVSASVSSDASASVSAASSASVREASSAASPVEALPESWSWSAGLSAPSSAS